MNAPELIRVETRIAEKNQLIEQRWREGKLAQGVTEFYTEDVRYLTTDFRMLHGRAQVVEFLQQIMSQFREVRLLPIETLGNPTGRRVVMQFANVQLHPRETSEPIVDAHYVAAFRPVGNDWLCEMEAPVFGKMAAQGDRS